MELPATSAVPAQLPADVAGFTGRAEALKQLDEALAPGPGGATGTVVTITGTAGAGKTTLAVHWGQSVRERFPDGQLYVNLRGFDPTGTPVDPADALRGFLDALGVPPERVPAALPALAALYRSTIADRRVLVVLDNAREAGQVRPLLPGGTTCLAVVTSRDLLSGLAAAEGARPVVLDLFGTTEAHDMLAARLGRGRVEAEPAAADAIVTGCARLPLALAVVAARAAAHPRFPLSGIAAELHAARTGLDAFAGRDRATDVRAVFSWSYRQLGEAAQRLFRLLALQPGPDVTRAAAADLAGTEPGTAHHLLVELAGSGLLTEHLPGRYAFHDLHRAYATELVRTVDPPAERRAAMHRLLDHYLYTALAADRLLDPHRDPIAPSPALAGVNPEWLTGHDRAMDWFVTELPALVALVERAEETRFDVHAWQLAWALAYFFERRGLWQPWLASQRSALRAASRAGDPAGQAHAHRSLGRVGVHLGDVEGAAEHLGRAQELFRAAGDLAGQARIHFDLCWIAFRGGSPSASLEHARAALELFRAAGNRSGEARALNNIAWGHTSLDEPREALAAGERACRRNVEIGDRYGEADSWDVLGHAHQALGDHARSLDCYRRALELYRELGHRWAQADTLDRLGDVHRAAGSPDAAGTAWREAVAILEELGHPDADRVRAKRAVPEPGA